ncbi:PIG-L deacetylase family protein [Streptacidiphilus cavernicola]|uniref:PIG-L deacetylase family protein n=1 Tax=Streptacidiphilus cavernicola TaxID=3342716 RepID=A0ABV6VW63_9ACTN
MRADWLVVLAHPDDETLHCGGLIAHAATRGERVVTLTLTRGGAGRTLGVCNPDELPGVREAELRAAARALGVSHVELHDLSDGEVDQNEAAAEALVTAALEKWCPRNVVCFPPNGFNGHPDHCAAHRVAVAALESHRRTGPGAAPAVWKITDAVPYGEPPRSGYLLPEEVERARLRPTDLVPVGTALEAKLRALGCYETQSRSITKLLRRYPGKVITEAFQRLG